MPSAAPGPSPSSARPATSAWDGRTCASTTPIPSCSSTTPRCSTRRCVAAAASPSRTPARPGWAPTGATTTPRSSRWSRSSRAIATATSSPGAPLTNRPDDPEYHRAVAADRRLRLERARQGLQAGVHRQLRPRLDASLVRHGVDDRSQPPRGARRHARAAHLRRHRQHRARVLDRRPVHGRRAARRRRWSAGDPRQGGGHQAVSHRRDPAQRPAHPPQLAGPRRRRAAVPRPRAGRQGRATTTRA